MDEYLRIWEPVLRNFKEHYEARCLAREQECYEIVDWYPSGHLEITVKLSNGDKLCYEFIGNRIWSLLSDDRNNIIDEESWRHIFSTRLKNRMRLCGVTQDRLSMLTGISRVTLSKYMNGAASPSGYNLNRICQALECSMSELTDVR